MNTCPEIRRSTGALIFASSAFRLFSAAICSADGGGGIFELMLARTSSDKRSYLIVPPPPRYFTITDCEENDLNSTSCNTRPSFKGRSFIVSAATKATSDKKQTRYFIGMSWPSPWLSARSPTSSLTVRRLRFFTWRPPLRTLTDGKSRCQNLAAKERKDHKEVESVFAASAFFCGYSLN